jgi:hypothetical protein
MFIPRSRMLRRAGSGTQRPLFGNGNETVSGAFLLLASKGVTLDATGSPSASERSIALGSPPRRYPERGDRVVGTAHPTNYHVVRRINTRSATACDAREPIGRLFTLRHSGDAVPRPLGFFALGQRQDRGEGDVI